MAKGIRALLDTVMQALPQVGNLGLLFFLLFFIFAALGVELFGRLECSEDLPCEGLGEHAHFKDFGMAFLTLFRVATGDNWNGIMKDTLRDNCDYSSDCIKNCCISPIIAPLYFVIFVLMAQFVLVNVVVAVLMKHLEESHKQMDDDMEMDAELERELAAEEQMKERTLAEKMASVKRREKGSPRWKPHRPLVKMASLPPNFVFPFNADDKGYQHASLNLRSSRNTTDCVFSDSCDLPTASPTSIFAPLQAAPANPPNVNIRQASPDEAENKVSVANLSPGPLHCGSSLSVPSGAFSSQSSPIKSLNYDFDVKETRKDRDASGDQKPWVDDWACVFQSMNTDPYKIHYLPVLRNDVLGSTNSCDSRPMESVGINRDQGLPKAFPPFQTLRETALKDCWQASGCAVDSLRTANQSESGRGSFPSVLCEENLAGEPLILRRLRKKLISLEGQSSLSSQSDLPSEGKERTCSTDSTSLDC